MEKCNILSSLRLEDNLLKISDLRVIESEEMSLKNLELLVGLQAFSLWSHPYEDTAYRYPQTHYEEDEVLNLESPKKQKRSLRNALLSHIY